MDYYNTLATHLGCTDIPTSLELATTPDHEAAIDQRLGRLDPDRPPVVLNPGANYGLGSWWAGLSPAGKSWTIVAIVAVIGITAAAVSSSDDDEEPPVSPSVY